MEGELYGGNIRLKGGHRNISDEKMGAVEYKKRKDNLTYNSEVKLTGCGKGLIMK